MKTLSLVVEGDGDQGAMPVVIRRYLQQHAIFDIAVGKPINAKGRTKLLREGELERFARLASLQTDAVAILVTCDGDKDAACDLPSSAANWGCWVSKTCCEQGFIRGEQVFDVYLGGSGRGGPVGAIRRGSARRA